MNRNPNISIVLASENSLTRTGVKYFLKTLGLDHLVEEVDNMKLLETKCGEAYLIMDHKMMTKPKGHFFRNVLSCFDGQILVIGSTTMSPEFHKHIILPKDNEYEILSKLELFLSDLLKENQTETNTVLSAREIDILKEVALGYSNKEIADRLFISINTVITHRKNITDKLGIKTISGLTVYALMNNLIDPKEVTI